MNDKDSNTVERVSISLPLPIPIYDKIKLDDEQVLLVGDIDRGGVIASMRERARQEAETA